MHNSLTASERTRQWSGNLFVTFPEAKMLDLQWHKILLPSGSDPRSKLKIFGASLI